MNEQVKQLRRRLAGAFGALLVIVPLQAGAASTVAGPSPRAFELARVIVEADQRQTKPVDFSKISQAVAKAVDDLLQTKASSQSANVSAIIEKEFAGLADDWMNAVASAIAQTATEQDLEAELAFKNGPLGKAFGQAGAAARLALRTALISGQPPAAGPNIPENRLVLINRIIDADRLEGLLRQTFRAASQTYISMLHINLQDGPDGMKAAEDVFVKTNLDVDRQAYASALTDGQLRDIAAYEDSPIARRLAARRPQMLRLESTLILEDVKRRFAAIDEEVCAAERCTAAQKSALSANLGQTTSALEGILAKLNDSAPAR